FSSRRRHTRFSRDWSSDVCSSDLHPPPLTISGPLGRGASAGERGGREQAGGRCGAQRREGGRGEENRPDGGSQRSAAEEAAEAGVSTIASSAARGPSHKGGDGRRPLQLVVGRARVHRRVVPGGAVGLLHVPDGVDER